MKCCNCGSIRTANTKILSDEYTEQCKECAACGHIWTFIGEKLVTIKQGLEILQG